MNNVTQYSDQELSLNFMNDEGLYNDLLRAARRRDFAPVMEIADELFIYTPSQLEDLKETFEQEVKEYHREEETEEETEQDEDQPETIYQKYDFETMPEFYDYIVESEINGNRSQVKDLLQECTPVQVKEFIQYLDSGEIWNVENDDPAICKRIALEVLTDKASKEVL